ncbi:AraC family transcriptional regulator [Aequorivita sp. H23M31]|uniref:AraC family transcriptional regulator n=1 Tax=Aequorivita ciconiae TaxID=2494375 RepID=A0A410G0Z2_9FLAO|nr:helix-turn-helix domain-containing protein [Aequorivita sp. H23M31]QAA80921.1 AraC family transcriptional regulator [Aequorivita sp. H23M31]
MPKITLLPPCKSLSSFVKNYQYLEFDTEQKDLIKPWHALPEAYLVFFLNDRPLGMVSEKGRSLFEVQSNIWIQGLATHFNGLMKFNGTYRIWLVQFLPSGFQRLLGLPLDGITNQLVDAEGIWGQKCSDLQKRLQDSVKPEEMAILVDAFLRNFISLKNLHNEKDPITIVSNEINRTQSFANINVYAKKANMSTRNFERKFREQVGTSPKLYCQLLRFLHAVELKSALPQKNWTEITYECGYFDQMHLIKDFKRFSDSTPQNFFLNTPPPLVEYSKEPREFSIG